MRDEDSPTKGGLAVLAVIIFIVVCVFIWRDEPTIVVGNQAESEIVVGNVTNAEWQKIQQQKDEDKRRKLEATATALQALGEVLSALGDAD
jgi:hypothetical protein